MRFFIRVSLIEQLKDYSILIDKVTNNCYMTLYTRPDINIEEIINKDNLIELLKINLELAKSDYDTRSEIDFKTVLNELLNSGDEIFSKLSIIFDYPTKENAMYIDNNPVLKNKKIILTNNLNMNYKEVDMVEKYFGKYNNLYVSVKNDKVVVPFSDYKKAVNIIEEYTNIIKKHNLSPLESIMYAYDLVRNRIYKKEKEGEPGYISRDTTFSLLGDKIVCLGFANIFDKILFNLGIKSKVFLLSNKNKKKKGHARNVVYIDDKKYDVNGIYYFDTTWDRKRNDSNTFLYYYRYFCMNKMQIKKYSKKYNDITFAGYKREIGKDMNNDLFENGFISKSSLNTVNEVSRFVDDTELLDPLLAYDTSSNNINIDVDFDDNKVIKSINKYNKLIYNKRLDYETFLRLLCNVRKVEYYDNPELFPYSIEDIKRIVDGYYENLKESDDGFDPNMVEDYLLNNNIEKEIANVKNFKFLKK